MPEYAEQVWRKTVYLTEMQKHVLDDLVDRITTNPDPKTVKFFVGLLTGKTTLLSVLERKLSDTRVWEEKTRSA